MNIKGRFIIHKTGIMTTTVITVSVSFFIIISVLFFYLFNSLQDAAKSEMLSKGQEYAGIFENKLNYGMNYLSVASSIIHSQIDAGQTDRVKLKDEFVDIFNDYKLIDGTSIMIESNKYDGKDDEYIASEYGTTASGKICYYIYTENGKTCYLPQVYDHDLEFLEPHYTDARDTNKPIYTRPTVYEIDGTDIPMFTLSHPINDDNGSFIGVVTVDLFLEDLYAQLQSERIYNTGYMVVTNDKDQTIYSPIFDDIGKSRKDAGVEFTLPRINETHATSYAASIINGKRCLVTTVNIYIPQLRSNFYVSVVAPVGEIYFEGIQLMFILTMFSVIVLALILMILTKNIVNPITDITSRANMFADGNYDEINDFNNIDENMKTKNEIYILYIAAKKMLAQLNEAQALKLESLQLKLEKDKAEEATKTKSNFLAKMSHEIRTPMNAIVGMSELILREDIPPSIYEHAVGIKQAGANLLSIINDILDISKIESGKLEISLAKYEIASLLNDVVSIIRIRLADKPIHFVVNTDSNIPAYLIGDEIRIRQVLLNLLSNAVKYTEKGFISMTVTGEIEENIVNLSIDITDTGIGLKEEDIEKLFGDFVQVDLLKNKNVQGTGLGLAITKKFCQAMGGDVSVYSEYGKGSTFSVTLPQSFEKYEKFAVVNDPDKKQVLVYETRNVYSDSIICSIDNLGVNCTLAENQSVFFNELETDMYNYVFVSSFMYESARNILDRLGVKSKLILLSEFGDTAAPKSVTTVDMPVHSISLANVLNDVESNTSYNNNSEMGIRFIAPDAHILIVDDISTNLQVAKGLMSPYKMQIDICKSGAEAIELVKTNHYDIVFMDHMMPEMDGIEATTIIREMDEEYYKKLPIIALTANAVAGVKEMFLQNGMDDFLSKPIETSKLDSMLEKWIPRSKRLKYIAESADTNSSESSELSFLDNLLSKDWTLPQVPFEINGIITEKGIQTTGSVNNYLKALSTFYKDGFEKIKQLNSSLNNNDIGLYTTYAHALKSASACIGAIDLSEQAKALEYAGNNSDKQFILDNNEAFINDLELLLQNILPVIDKKQSTGEDTDSVDVEALGNELVSLKEALEAMDAGTVETIMNKLQASKWDDKTDDMLEKIAYSILMFDYDEAVQNINEYMNMQ